MSNIVIPAGVMPVRLYNNGDPQLDAFHRQRVSANHQLMQSQFIHDLQPLIWETSASGGASAALNTAKACVTLTVPTTADASAVRQTKRYYQYRPGQAHSVRTTFLATRVANVRKRAGYFDANNGLFLEINGTTDIALVRRTNVTGSPVETRVLQADWNMDTFDGNGASGVTLDWTMAQHLIIDLQWLGVGQVLFGFEALGRLIYAHRLTLSNSLATVYMSTGTLPVRYEITNTATSAGATMDQICSSVIREGGDEEPGLPTAVATAMTGTTATTTPRSALSVCLRDSHIRAFVLPRHIDLINLGNDTVFYQLVLNGTFGGSLTFADTGQAGLRSSLTQQTYTPGTGHVLMNGFINSGTGGAAKQELTADIKESALGVTANIAGVSDVLSVVLTSASGTLTCGVGLELLEYF